MSCSSSSGSEDDDEGIDSYRKGGYHAVRVGDQFAGGRYVAQRKLGWGQFSTVWLAYDTTTSTYVALKIQKSAAQFAQAALHEIEVLSNIADGDPTNSKCVVRLIDHFKHAGPNGQHQCMVLEFLGDSLLRLIKYNHYKGLKLNQVREICKCILIGLDYLHRELGIIHTDLKPENILLFTTIDPAKDPVRSSLTPILERPEGNLNGGATMNLIEKKLKRRARRAVAKISMRRESMGGVEAPKSERNMDGIDVRCKVVDFGFDFHGLRFRASGFKTQKEKSPPSFSISLSLFHNSHPPLSSLFTDQSSPLNQISSSSSLNGTVSAPIHSDFAMDTDEAQRVLPFQLQFDKPVASQIKIAEWNPEKDLLAMVTEDSKILLHRFNWQRLWTVSPGKSITSLCWRPDGKAIAVGLEDGTVSLLDVENGKLLRSLKSHGVAVVSLNWEEDGQMTKDEQGSISTYEDRTPHFFPPPPRVPRMPGLVSGDTGFIDDSEDSFRELSNSSQQRFNILCSGDKDGFICFSIFGIFPIGKINIHNFCVPTPLMDTKAECRLQNASVHKVALSKDLCHLIVICSGELSEDRKESENRSMTQHGVRGLHCTVLDTSIFWKRKNELHQVAQQASNIEELVEVIRASLSVMHKQWSDAMHTFHEKFDSLSNLIIDNGLDSCPQEEFLSLLGGARTSPAVHQFLVNSLGEVGVKRVSKAVCGAGKELQLIVLNHLQPAAEIIAFRMGELRGLSRWRARYQGIGLDEALINNATEKAGMILIQVERFIRVLSTVVQQFSNFFNWLLKCIKLLMSEPSDHHLLLYNSELVVIFLKFLYDQDPVKQLLEASETDDHIEVGLETMQRVKELVQFGGFSDFEYLQRTLAKEFQQVESSFKEAFLMPFTTISRKILCGDLLPLCPLPPLSASLSSTIPMSVSYYEDASQSVSSHHSQHMLLDYISFQIPDDSFSGFSNCIGIVRGFMHDSISVKRGYTSLEAVLLCVPGGYCCADLSLYKESQIVLLLNETTATSESSGNASMMIVQANDLPFVSISRSTGLNYWKLHQLEDSVVHLQMENEKVRSIPHSVIAPLAVSSSRGVACVFAVRKRALVYILEEDEDEVSDAE